MLRLSTDALERCLFITCDVFIEMSSPAVKRPAPNLPPKPVPRRQTSDSMSDGAPVVSGNGNAGNHDVTSSASSSTDESVQLVAELPDTRRVILFVDARYLPAHFR